MNIRSISIGLLFFPFIVSAEIIPKAADAARVIVDEKMQFSKDVTGQELTISKIAPTTDVPEAAKAIHFVLKSVNIEDMTAFTQEKMLEAYASYLEKEVSLSVVWLITEEITKRYRNAGYFLSRAYVPQQTIKNGQITIKVVEGYVSKVELPEKVQKNYVVQGYINKLMLQKPTSIEAVESFLLRLNDLPGYSFRSVVSPIDNKDGNENETKLILIPVEEKSKGTISFDNFSSRYTGPNEASASYSTSIIPLQQTSIGGISSLPTNKLSYGMLSHSVVIAPNTTLGLNTSSTKTYPGYNIENLHVNSSANSTNLSLNYQWIRQRRENLSLIFTLSSINVASNILGTTLIRDHIRVLRAGFNYDKDDNWHGHNVMSLTTSKAIDGMDSSGTSDLNLSRAEAKPNFTKTELILSRLQEITEDWSALASSSSQISSGTLYSSEQFGYGGQSFGRAYDSSEITGDKGINASLELRYEGFKFPEKIHLQPYGFYDIGTVRNFSSSQVSRQSGASAGLGLRFATTLNQTGNIGIAWPLTRDISTPIYGKNKRAPRFMFQISQDF